MTNQQDSSHRTPALRSLAPHDRFGRLIERADGVDFPFYNGSPVALSGAKWFLIWAATAVGYFALILIPQPNNWAAVIPRALFVLIPLLALGLCAGPAWRALFRRVRGADVGAMFGFAALNLAVTLAVGPLIAKLFGSNANPTVAETGAGGAWDTVGFFAGSAVQLLGEELFTLLPFLAILAILFQRAKLSRKTAIILAWVISALWFGAAHLPTYGWNVAQALITIGSARFALTLAFIRTKNIWVAAGAHILNDWFLFALAMILPGLAAATFLG